MSHTDNERYLLPAGMRDGLPPDAAFEAAIVERLMRHVAAWGYDRVKPPLIEFEDSLLSGPGEAMRAHTFRLMDPVSQRMMGLRADMTPQVGRIAASRLGNEPRPLRLSYAGQVLRVRGEQMSPERQIGQVGIEMIGSAASAADAEVVLLAAEALGEVGVGDLTIDLNIPTLVPSILRQRGVVDPGPLIMALDRKDATTARALAGDAWPVLETLLRSIGAVQDSLAVLRSLELNGEAAKELDRLVDVVALIGAASPGQRLTIDPTDHRGFEYHTGVTFSFLGRGSRREYGRGGRYVNQAGEDATGFTLYLDALISALPAPVPARRVFLPNGVGEHVARRLRQEGWVTICGLDPSAEALSESRRMRCSHVWQNGRAVEVGD